MKKFAFAALLATAATANAAQGQLGLGYDRTLTGQEGISVIVGAQPLMVQGVVGFNFASQDSAAKVNNDTANQMNLGVRLMAKVAEVGQLSARMGGGVGFSNIIGEKDLQTTFEAPLVLEYRLHPNFSISTQFGLQINIQDGNLSMGSAGTLLGSAGFHMWM